MKIEFENDFITGQNNETNKIRVIKCFEGTLKEFQEISNKLIFIKTQNLK